MSDGYHPRVSEWLRRKLDALEGISPLKTFALSITDRCNIKCDFCCHPYMDSEIPEEEAARMTEEACQEDFHEICVTGGEPMLRRKLVYRLAAIARANDVMFGFISNGYWAKTPAAAEAEIGRLAAAGVTRMTISWDPSHGEFVPAARALNAIRAGMEGGLKVTLVGSFKDAALDHGDFGIDLSPFEPFRNFRVIRHAVSSAGRGEGLELDVWDRRDLSGMAQGEAKVLCPSLSIQELVVFSKTGLTQPCCSIYAGYKAPHLRVGDWRKQSVRDLVAAHESDGYFRIIRSGGFGRIYEIVREQRPDLLDAMPDPKKAADACNLCADIMRSRAGPTVRKLCDKTFERSIAGAVEEMLRLAS